ncbi:MAG: hypothetical protein NXI32_03075 [bacterium]|nr:hypothetical protein [bacterium]
MFRQLVAFTLLFFICGQRSDSFAIGQDELWDDDLPEFLNGLVGHYSSGERSFERLDDDLLFDWSLQTVDERLSAGNPFAVTWHGYLQVKDNGEFRLNAFAAGTLRVRLAEKLILDVESTAAEWHACEPIPLKFGRHPIQIEYHSPPEAEQSRFGLYWSGPGFQLEPVAPRYLWHATAETPDRMFETGRALSRSLRCVACHIFDSQQDMSPALLPAPALTHLQDNLLPAWLVAHLRVAEPAEDELSLAKRRMPYFGLDKNSAMAISAALLDTSLPSPSAPDLRAELRQQSKQGKNNPPALEADPEQGAMTFASVGCIACHQLGELGIREELEQQLFSGGDLSHIGSKRPPGFFARWLAEPAAVNGDHRMPTFELTVREQLDLQAFLNSQADETSSTATTAAGDIQRGIGLIQQHRCGACHQLPEKLTTQIQKTRVDANSNWQAGCLTGSDAQKRVPGFGLSQQHRDALRAYLTLAIPQSLKVDGKQLLVERNCVACHGRDQATGITPLLPDIAKAHTELAPRLAGLSPPSLTGVGDKLTDAAWKSAVSGTQPRLRPWLDIRMPKFAWDPEDLEALTSFVLGHDRIPNPPYPDQRTAEADLPTDIATELAVSRLVTSDGFGCQSCHQIADFDPPEVDLKARGPNLSMPGQRIRESWFQRWVRNPSRIVPRMEMPAVQTAAKGVLKEDLDQQLDALWRILNRPDFRPPRPNPVRVVRTYNQPALDEHAQLVTCVIETEHRKYIRPLAIGLPNRHNLLFDLEQGLLAGWWIGDTAAQHTRAKTWYWELGSRFLNSELAPESGTLSDRGPCLEQVQIEDSQGRVWRPAVSGQVAVSLDAVSHTENGLQWSGRLHLASGNEQRQTAMRQHIFPTANAVVVETSLEVAAGERVLLTSDAQAVAENQQVSLRVTEECRISVQATDAIVSLQSDKLSIEPAQPAARVVTWQSILSTRLPEQSFPHQTATVAQNQNPKSLECVPGYEAIQLPLPRGEMPISFAWGKETDAFFVGSLKGRVLRAIDQDGDGLQEQYRVISDDYPTPFGLHANQDGSLDALTKFALIRFQPGPHRQAPWDATVVADGWGYTSDYHDWAVGLEMDDAQNYWIALPCQQDDRSQAAAYLRGHAVKLIPNSDSADTQRKYRLESIAAGLRFPMGIALSPSGDLFTTDNQGNYNPFNELNHIRSNKRYGFINKLENRDGFSPPFESPAINLPHPWSRSVNGICWLNTPPALAEQGVRNRFGPFEGHLVGCEMNGRSLVRMSLQRVGDTFQGAAYAFSLPGLDPSETFEGPIACAVSPAGDLYIGSLQDSGWGAGQNTGSIVRLRPNGSLPPGIAEVRARPDGLTIDFTQAVDGRLARSSDAYQIRSYRRVSTPAYGGDDQEERQEKPSSIELTEDRMQVYLRFPSLRSDCVYEITIGDTAADGEALFPNQAHYTMRSIPKE